MYVCVRTAIRMVFHGLSKCSFSKGIYKWRMEFWNEMGTMVAGFENLLVADTIIDDNRKKAMLLCTSSLIDS